MPLPVASRSPWLVRLLLMKRGLEELLALMMPAAWLVMTRPLLPICPAP